MIMFIIIKDVEMLKNKNLLKEFAVNNDYEEEYREYCDIADNEELNDYYDKQTFNELKEDFVLFVKMLRII